MPSERLLATGDGAGASVAQPAAALLNRHNAAPAALVTQAWEDEV
jgi:hypothetical protein